MSVFADLYRKYMPIKIRYYIGKARTKKSNKEIFRRVCKGDWDKDYHEECEYMRQIGRVETFPYKWIEKYNKKSLKVFLDNNNKMPYVLVEGKKLYFPKRYPADYIRTYLNTLLIEQDSRSAHYYFDPKDNRLKDTVFVDVGGAEGFISLLMIDKVSELIIFECDEDWINALQATFEPWKNKVEIINKYADKITDSRHIRIDDIVSKKNNVVLKLDVEGMESQVLKGAENTLKSKDTKAFVCLYHKKDDEINITKILEDYSFNIEKSESFMFYGKKDDIGFRRGVVRAWNKEECHS